MNQQYQIGQKVVKKVPKFVNGGNEIIVEKVIGYVSIITSQEFESQLVDDGCCYYVEFEGDPRHLPEFNSIEISQMVEV